MISDVIFLGILEKRLHYPNTKELGAFWKSGRDGSILKGSINGLEITRAMAKTFGH